jgi:hypothetical protein
MLVGRPPFDGPNDFVIQAQHLNHPPPPLEQFKPDIPKPVSALTMTALKKLPEERFQGCGEFRAALRDLEQALESHHKVPLEEDVRNVSRVAVGGVATVLAILVGILGSQFYRSTANDDDWDRVQPDSASEVQAYQASHPTGPHHAEADRVRVALAEKRRVEEEWAVWEKVPKDSREAVEEYLRQHPGEAPQHVAAQLAQALRSGAVSAPKRAPVQHKAGSAPPKPVPKPGRPQANAGPGWLRR